MATRLTRMLLAIFLALAAMPALAARIKDIASIEGAGTVQAIGYGLVTGLSNTGDNQQSSFTVQSVTNMLKRFGLTVPSSSPRVRNVAAVMVTANIPVFTRAGSKVNVEVSSIGDASSLQGGVLLMTPVSKVDGTIIGMAQGALTTGGYDVSAYGSRVGKNVSSTGRVPNGLVLDASMEGNIVNNNQVRISLHSPDFTTAQRIADAVNSIGGMAGSAVAADAGSVQVQLPAGQAPAQRMAMISQIESQNVISDPVAKVVINERTGTIVIGGNVQLLPATIAHSGLQITIQKQVIVPQPAPFQIRPPAQKPVETAEVKTEEETGKVTGLVVQGPTVQDMANALNLLQVQPRDLISIFQALQESGSLQGELVIQ